MSNARRPSGSLRAGAAQVEITPRTGVHLSGAVGTHRPARVVADPLYARALVFECAGKRVCFLSLDVTIVTQEYTALIRRAASEELGIEPDAIMVHATQTHSAPSLGHFMVDPDFEGLEGELEWLRGGDTEYSLWAAGQAVEAIRQANCALAPARIAAGSAIEGRFAFNRRAVMRDGRVTMPGRTWEGGALGPTGIRYIEGPTDPEVGVLCVLTPELRVASALLHYTCHPVHVFPKQLVSADWPGALADAFRATYGSQCVALVLNGACGNINPWPPFDPDYVEDHRRMGSVLAERAERVVETLSFTDEGVLDWGIRVVPIPLREVPPDRLEWARQVLSEGPQPAWAGSERSGVTWDWAIAASVYSVHLARQRSPYLDYEVQALRVGDTAFVGLPGEPFVEGQLRIKIGSPTYPTYVAHCTSQYVGYIPTQDALQRGGHEASTTYWAKLAPNALDVIVEEALDLLRELFPAG